MRAAFVLLWAVAATAQNVVPGQSPTNVNDAHQSADAKDAKDPWMDVGLEVMRCFHEGAASVGDSTGAIDSTDSFGATGATSASRRATASSSRATASSSRGRDCVDQHDCAYDPLDARARTAEDPHTHAEMVNRAGLTDMLGPFGGLLNVIPGMGGGAAGAGGGAPQNPLTSMMDTVKNMGQMAGLMAKMAGGASGGASGLMALLKMLMSTFTAVMGGLAPKPQANLKDMATVTSHVFTSTLHEHLGDPNNLHPTVAAELNVIPQVFAQKHENVESLMKALQEKAPQISKASKAAYEKAHEEFVSKKENLHPEAKEAVDKMVHTLQTAHANMVEATSDGPGEAPLSSLKNMVNNALTFVKMFF